MAPLIRAYKRVKRDNIDGRNRVTLIQNKFARLTFVHFIGVFPWP